MHILFNSTSSNIAIAGAGQSPKVKDVTAKDRKKKKESNQRIPVINKTWRVVAMGLEYHVSD